ASSLATDCDGTTWRGDIGQCLFETMLQERRLHERATEPLAEIASELGLIAKGEPHQDAQQMREAYESGRLHEGAIERHGTADRGTQRYYQAQAVCLAGHSVQAIKVWTRDLFEEGGFSRQIFTGAKNLLARARAAGVIPYAISASSQW